MKKKRKSSFIKLCDQFKMSPLNIKKNKKELSTNNRIYEDYGQSVKLQLHNTLVKPTCK